MLPEEEHWTTGHLLQLWNPPATLITLDDYEGIVPGKEENSPYRRQLAEVFANGQMETAWVYVYNEPVDEFPVIPFSNYLDYLKINDAHQKFIQSV